MYSQYLERLKQFVSVELVNWQQLNSDTSAQEASGEVFFLFWSIGSIEIEFDGKIFGKSSIRHPDRERPWKKYSWHDHQLR